MHPSADTAASSADKACLGSGVVETEPWEQIFMPQLKRRLNRNRFSLPCLLLARTQMLYQHCGLYALLKLVSQAESIVLISSLWGKLTWSKSGYLRSRYSEASEQGFLSHVCPCSAWQGGLKSLEKSEENNSRLQGPGNRRKRTGLGKSEINARFSVLFRGNEKNPNTLFGVNPNHILSAMFCFEVSHPSCFSHFLLFQVSFEWKMPLQNSKPKGCV